jgi:hypothetical protein
MRSPALPCLLVLALASAPAAYAQQTPPAPPTAKAGEVLLCNVVIRKDVVLPTDQMACGRTPDTWYTLADLYKAGWRVTQMSVAYIPGADVSKQYFVLEPRG